MRDDPWVELRVCQDLAEQAQPSELFVYPGSGRLFADPGSPDFDPTLARLLMDRTPAFLRRVRPDGAAEPIAVGTWPAFRGSGEGRPPRRVALTANRPPPGRPRRTRPRSA